jgi:hypothetical protein
MSAKQRRIDANIILRAGAGSTTDACSVTGLTRGVPHPIKVPTLDIVRNATGIGARHRPIKSCFAALCGPPTR